MKAPATRVEAVFRLSRDEGSIPSGSILRRPSPQSRRGAMQNALRSSAWRAEQGALISRPPSSGKVPMYAFISGVPPPIPTSVTWASPPISKPVLPSIMQVARPTPASTFPGKSPSPFILQTVPKLTPSNATSSTAPGTPLPVGTSGSGNRSRSKSNHGRRYKHQQYSAHRLWSRSGGRKKCSRPACGETSATISGVTPRGQLGKPTFVAR